MLRETFLKKGMVLKMKDEVQVDERRGIEYSQASINKWKEILSKHDLFCVVLGLAFLVLVIYYPFLKSNCGYWGSLDTAFQFVPYFTYLARNLAAGDFPMWIFGTGLGAALDITYISDFSKFVTVFAGAVFGVELIPQINLWVHFIKVISAGTFFYLFLKQIKICKRAAFIGAIAYAFSGIMLIRGVWLHYSMEMLLFAMLLLALERFFRFQKSFFLIVTISALFCHRGVYYVYLYTVILLFYAIVRYYTFPEIQIEQIGRYILKCFFVYIIALGISMCFLLPNIIQTLESGRGGKTIETISAVFNAVGGFASWDRVVAVFESFFSSGINGPFNSSFFCENGLDGPMFYSGVVMIFLFPQSLLYARKKLKKMMVVVSVIILLYFFCPAMTFIFNLGISESYFKLSSLWMLSFIIICSVYAMSEFLAGRLAFNKKWLLIQFFTVAAIFIYLKFVNSRYSSNTVRFNAMVALLCFVTWFVLLVLCNRSKLKTICIVAMMAEMVVSSYLIIRDGQYSFSNYLSLVVDEGYYGNLADALKKIDDEEEYVNSFYRVVKDFYVSNESIPWAWGYPTDPMFYGFNGLGYKDSYATKGNITFYDELGIDIGTNDVQFPYDRCVLENLLGVKYFLAKKALPIYFREIGSIGDVTIGKNTLNLPLGFTYSKYMTADYFNSLSDEEKEIALYYAAVCEEQNNYGLSLYANTEYDIEKIKNVRQDFQSPQWIENCEVENSKNAVKIITSSTKGKVIYQIEDGVAKTLSFKISSNRRGTGALMWYDGKSWYKEKYSVEETPSLVEIDFPYCEVKAISFEPVDVNDNTMSSKEYNIEDIEFAYYKSEDFKRILDEAYDACMQDVFEISNITSNHISGKIDVIEDKLLFFSIPFDSGWKIKVDGIKVDPECVNLGFIGIPLRPGVHKIELHYMLPGMRLGIIISIFFCGVWLIIKKNKLL